MDRSEVSWMELRLRRLVFAFFIFLVFLPELSYAQSGAKPLIAEAIDESRLIRLTGNTHPLAQPQFDIGRASPDQPIRRMLLVLKRSPEQEFALRKLLDEQQDKDSPNYHKWLTPEEFGAQFGPADQDLQAVTGWLQSHGLQINRLTQGRTIIEFSGVESQVEDALHTQIHKYVVNGEEHWANASDPQLPAALAPVVAGVQALNNFPARHFSHIGGVISRNKDTGKFSQVTPANPLFTLPAPSGCGVQASNCYAVGPFDFATIYDVLPAWNATPAIDGTGETIAIVGETDINPQDVTDFRNFFGLPAYAQPGGPNLNIIHDGAPPGILPGEENEADLDVEWSGAVAKGASIDFVVSETTETTLGVNLSALYVVDNNLAPVMSESFGNCELFLGSAGNRFFNALWQQAAAQGITAMVSAGDGGSAGCDNFHASGAATHGLQVSGFASTPYNVAVGGTDFNDLTDASTFWSISNNSTTRASALSYVPETTWDSNCTNPVFATLGFSNNAETNCNNPQLVSRGFVNILSGSGGKSSCINSDGQNPSSCAGGYPKPSWQIAPGVPQDGVRDLPDVSLFASVNSPSGSFYIICEADVVNGSSCDPNNPSTQFLGIGGTSASSPAFAGIMALVNQQQQSRQGNANFVLYKLAQQQPNSFHDITSGTIEVPCQTGSPNCLTAQAGDQFGILNGYNTAVGYDLATGIGSVDVHNLLQNWPLAKFTATTTSLSLSPTTNLTHGKAVTVTASVAPSSGGGIPTGNISLITSAGVGVAGTSVGVDGFILNGSGAVSGTTSLLPGGSYTVHAHYSGDPTFGSSDSPPVSVTVGKENSSAQFKLVTFDFSGHLLSNNATTAVYGSPHLLHVDILNSQGIACQPSPLGEAGCPTGNVTLTDNGTPVPGTFALNSQGYTEDQAVQLPGGSNTVTANYVGDNSFNASSSSTTYNITPAPTTLSAPSNGGGQVGALFTTSATVQAQSSGAAPGGTVKFFANGVAIQGTPFYSSNSGAANASATLQATLTSSSSPFPSAGTYSITASYSGDGNYASTNSAPSSIFIQFPPPLLSMVSPTIGVSAGGTVTVSALIDSGFKNVPVPTGSVNFINWGPMTPVNGSETFSTTTDVNGNVALLASITFVPAASESIAVSYNGDSNYPQASGGGLTDITVTGADFALVPNASSIPGIPGESSFVQIFIQAQSNYNGTISFSPTSCSGLPAESSCSFNPASVTGAGSTGLTINTTAPLPSSANLKHDLDNKSLPLLASMPLAAILLFTFPRKPVRRAIRGLAALLMLMSMGCGGGSPNGGTGAGGGGNSGNPGTPPGSYTVTVTATSGSGASAVTHATSFTLVVQSAKR